ncbi:X-ray radiation resistance-associated protein 1-like isoform X2 [Littorina saxatilis]|uniref:X-ray radiation resistance-associated protein 1-like isoform X2 n=1 Tax=Littorina saxatilis TaxID=31220 RepID=UPI0038B60F47
MALAGIKLESDCGGFVSNCFPVRGLNKRDALGGDGAWFVAHRAEQRRRFKAVLCAKPRTYSRIREERKRAEDEGVGMTASQFEEAEQEESEQPVLDGYFLMKHCCIEDPADLCSVNIASLELSEVKEEDFEIFDNVAYINAGENYLPFEAFRGFPSLRELEMPLNGLRSLKFQMTDFPTLEVLELSYNNLSHDDILKLGLLPRLRVLHLTGNNFSTLPPDMSLPYISSDRKIRRQRFAKLEVLLLDDNKLSDISVFAALAGVPKLRHINMEKNKIFCIPQLKCVEGRVVTHDSSPPKRPESGRRSARRSKSRQSGLLSARKEAEEQLKQQPAEHVGHPSSLVEGEVTENKESQNDADLTELMKDDFSLGGLEDRITELEEETEKGIGPGIDPVTGKPVQGDYVPKALPPFPELRYLNLANNRIREEDALLAVAVWPMLVHLVIHNNPLTTDHKGEPPLLRRFLTDRLGIKLQRKEQPRLVKPNIDVPKSKSRQVSDFVPKVPRSTIEERLQQLALEAPKTAPAIDPVPAKSWLAEDRTLSGLDLETSKRMPLPPIPHTPPSAQTARSQAWGDKPQWEETQVGEEGEEGAQVRPDSGAFFMTQVDGQDEEQEGEKKSKKGSTAKRADKKDKNTNNSNNFNDDRYKLLMDIDSNVEMEVELPKDIQGNVRALKHALGHTLVYRDASVDLDRVKRTVPEFRRAPVPPAKPHKSRQERIDEVLMLLRNRETIDEETLINVLKDPQLCRKKFPDAKHLLSQIQRRYNAVRVSSMKEATDARKIIDQAFEVLNKPKQTYTPSC